jgi:murein DD-endopeptidase MepM/ murein hydrolase activator NlpD
MGVLLGLMTSSPGDSSYQAHFLQDHIEVEFNAALPRAADRAIEIAIMQSSSQSSSMQSSAIPILHNASSAQQSSVASSTQSSAEPLRPAAENNSQAVSSAQISSVGVASSEASSSISNASDFPAFGNAVHPVSTVPNWGIMTSADEWERPYGQMKQEEFVAIPSYSLPILTIPMETLLEDRMSEESIRTITAKLYYSTRYFGAYDLDASEFSAVHPGIDLKLPQNTPVGALAGGKVHDIRREDEGLGLFVVVEHRASDGQTFYSVYGHLESVAVAKGDAVASGEYIGTVGMTGETTGPHLHLQVDRGEPNEAYHIVYWPSAVPSRAEAEVHAINPIAFIAQY